MNITKVYKLYSISMLVMAYLVILSIWLGSSEQGLTNGKYFVTVETDVIGENWIELLILLSALPGALWIAVETVTGKRLQRRKQQQSVPVQ